MNADELSLIRATFARLKRNKTNFGRLFYDRLFAIAPDARPLFKGNLDAQVHKLMDSLAIIIGSADNGPTLASILQNLAVRHVTYGVRSKHYDKLGEALLWTLQQELGDDFTPKVRDAWASLYVSVATAMKHAAALAE
jgi:hemoglobin-like flavoprotein